MKKSALFSLPLLFISLVTLAGCAGTPKGFGTPTTHCVVTEKPNPLLMGGWSTVYIATTEDGKKDSNPVKYWLVKDGDRYALHFDRTTRGGKKRYFGWKSWTISGDEITSDTGVRIFAMDGKVFYDWRGQGPKEMKRIGN